MLNITEVLAFALGVIGTMIIALILLIGLLTRDHSPAKQRAQRLAIVTSSAAVLVIGISDGLIYAFVDTRLGSFLVVPYLAIAGYLLLVGTAKLNRIYSARLTSEEESIDRNLVRDMNDAFIKRIELLENDKPTIKLVKVPERIDAQTREHQAAFRDKLKALPQFQETFEEDLINLITGDRVFWSDYAGEPCLAIQVSGKLTINVCRFETLRRYVSIQESLATHFPFESNLAMTGEDALKPQAI
jgi:hypothetical protein